MPQPVSELEKDEKENEKKSSNYCKRYPKRREAAIFETKQNRRAKPTFSKASELKIQILKNMTP